MKKFFGLILILSTCILVIFSGSSSGAKTTDFLDKFDGANTDELISKPYNTFSSDALRNEYYYYYDNKLNYSKSYTYTNSNGSIVSIVGNTVTYERILIFSDYVYDITFRSDYPSYVSNLLDFGSLFIDLPYDYLHVKVYMKPSSLGFDLFSDTIPITGSYGITSKGYVPYTLYVNKNTGDGYRLDPSYSQLEHKELQKAFDHFFYELDLDFIPKSDDISYGFTHYGYNYVSGSFYSNFTLADFSIGNGGKFIESISVGIDSIGSPPSIPDSSDYDGPLEFVGSYFSWITKEIVYIFKFASVFLKGVF